MSFHDLLSISKSSAVHRPRAGCILWGRTYNTAIGIYYKSSSRPSLEVPALRGWMCLRERIPRYYKDCMILPLNRYQAQDSELPPWSIVWVVIYGRQMGLGIDSPLHPEEPIMIYFSSFGMSRATTKDLWDTEGVVLTTQSHLTSFFGLYKT